MTKYDVKNKAVIKELQETRDSFKSKTGFIIACIGSAVGMGNIWLFSYRVGQFGGAAFLIPYFFFVIVIGLSGVIEEFAFARSMKSGALGSFDKAFKMRGKNGGGMLGMIPVLTSWGIAMGYAVVLGWVLKFMAGSFTGDVLTSQDSGAYFGAIVGTFGSIGWHVAILVLMFFTMILGIAKGIEKINKIMMPLFFLLFVVLAVYIATLPGAVEGYKYLFMPKWNVLADPKTWVYALGQAFFSLSLGGGMLIYGSYLKESEDVISCAKYTVFFDTFASFIAAIVIIPAVFAFALDPGAGPPLLFITMPNVFKLMPGGQLVAIIFFIAVLFAGVTSLMNLLEPPIEALQQKFNFSRLESSSIVIIFTIGVGVFLENADVLGKWMDILSIYAIPLCAFLCAIVFFWVCGKRFALEQIQLGQKKPVSPWVVFLGKYVFCIFTFLILVLGIYGIR